MFISSIPHSSISVTPHRPAFFLFGVHLLFLDRGRVADRFGRERPELEDIVRVDFPLVEVRVDFPLVEVTSTSPVIKEKLALDSTESRI